VPARLGVQRRAVCGRQVRRSGLSQRNLRPGDGAVPRRPLCRSKVPPWAGLRPRAWDMRGALR
jgi:hypothetical protein